MQSCQTPAQDGERRRTEKKKSRTVSLNKDGPTSRESVYQTDYQRTGVGAAARDRLATIEKQAPNLNSASIVTV